ncbi:MAG TPA: cytidine deaminase [Blastocatellia bacterium]|nr:cytidine deaminase [Blastocatellia bacterium]
MRNAIADSISDGELIEQAKQARQEAHAPFSNFQVGAAIMTSDGRVYTGCNIEQSVYSLTMCAERVAIFKAVSEGAREFVKVAVVADFEAVTPPCGCCRQSLWEFAGPGTKVILANLAGEVRRLDIEELLPLPFDATFLEEDR